MPSSLKTKRTSLSSRSRSTNERSQVDSDDEEPEEVQASAEELAVLREAFEKQYGSVSADGSHGEQEEEEDEKTRKRRKIREKRAKARATLENSQSQQKLDTSVLQGLDERALQEQSITIGEGDGREIDEDEDGENHAAQADGTGFHINKNTRSSVRLVEGNMEIHVLGETASKDLISSFVGASSGGRHDGHFTKPPPQLLEERSRVPFHAFSKQKKGGPARVFTDKPKQPKKNKAKKAVAK